jgi:hypothetical protein
MPMRQNISTPYQDEADDLTCRATTAVVGKTFVDISGNRTSGPLLNAATDGSNYLIAPCAAGARGLGVASYDGAIGDFVRVQIRPGRIAQVTAGGTIAAGAEVEVTTGGKVITFASGIKVGKCLNGAVNNGDAEIRLY